MRRFKVWQNRTFFNYNVGSLCGNSIYFNLSPELEIPDYIRDTTLIQKNIPFQEVERLEDVIGDLDVLYMTRVQKERFSMKKIMSV